MKYLRTLILGFLTGIVLFLAGFYLNPFSVSSQLNPLSVSNSRLAEYSYSRNPKDSLILTNNGETRTSTHPERVQELWEPAVEDSEAFVVVLRDTTGAPAGIGVKISSWSEETDLLHAKLIRNSDWHLYVPQHGTAFIEQTENRWPHIKSVMLPALIKGEWNGTWYGDITNGPNALRTARLRGGSGEMNGLQSEAVEFFQVESYSSKTGPQRSTGKLMIDLAEQQ